MKSLTLILFIAFCLNSSATRAAHLKPFQDKETELWGLKNSKGKVVVKPQYQAVIPEEKLIGVFKTNHVYRLDHNGKPKFESVFYDNGPDYYEEGLARFIQGGKIGFHDKKGDVIIQPKYDWASPFKDGRSFVCDGCFATFEKIPRYKAASSGSTGSMLGDEHLTVTGGKWGAINIKGEVTIPVTLGSWEEARKKSEAKP